jgi:hypothetical protein
MIDSMLLWLMLFLFLFLVCLGSLTYGTGLYEPGSVLGGLGPKMCVTKVWGFLGDKPWFYTFWGFWDCFRGLVYLAHVM